MTPRDLVEVALRVMGIWFVAVAIVSLAMTISYVLSDTWGSVLGQPGWLLGSLVMVVAQFAVGAVLMYRAPSIAAWFYRNDSASAATPVHILPGDAYHIACFVLGMYLVVRSIAEMFQGVTHLIQGGATSAYGPEVLSAAVQLLVGLALVFGAERIGRLMASLKYDPESVPRQRLSVATLLILVAAVAVVLGVIHAISGSDW